jgi:hypothetical protein
MKKTIILLEGPSETGKTASIRMLGNLMHQDLQTLIFKGKNWKECLEVHLLNGVKIGLSSRSDKIQTIRDGAELLMGEKGCDLVVIACNLNMKGFDILINEWESKEFEIRVVSKMPEFCNRIHREMHPLLNRRAAIRLLEEIRKTLPEQPPALQA